jgi:hypothetical protein
LKEEALDRAVLRTGCGRICGLVVRQTTEGMNGTGQYHSTNDLHSFNHLPPTLYNGFLPVLQFSPVSIIPPMIYTHSIIYQRSCIMFFSQHLSFHLSVSFHQCSILIIIIIDMFLSTKDIWTKPGNPHNQFSFACRDVLNRNVILVFRLRMRATRLLACCLLLAYLLTPWSRGLLENLAGFQLVKNLPVFYGTRRFIKAFTSARHLSLSRASSIQSILPHPIS